MTPCILYIFISAFITFITLRGRSLLLLTVYFLAFAFSSPCFGIDVASEKLFIQRIDSAVKSISEERFSEAEQIFNRAEAVPLMEYSDTARFHFYYNRGNLWFQMRNLDAAAEATTLALAIATGLNDRTRVLKSYASLANIHSAKGLSWDALRYQRLALKHVGEGDSVSYYAILNNLSLAYRSIGHVDSALIAQIAAKEFYQRSGDMERLAMVEGNLAEMYREDIGDYHMALIHYRRAVNIHKSLDSQSGLAINFHNMSLLFQQMDQNDSAHFYLNKALNVRDKMGDHGGRANLLHSMGTLYLAQGRNADALKVLAEALGISETHGIPIGVFHISISMAQANDALGEYKMALANIQRAVSLAGEQRWLREEAEAFKILYQFQRKHEHWEFALFAFEAFHALNDSLNKLHSTSSVQEVVGQYEARLARSEAKALREQQHVKNLEMQKRNWGILFLTLAIIGLIVVSSLLYRALNQRNTALSMNERTRQKLEEKLVLIEQKEAQLALALGFKDKVISVMGHDLRAPLGSIVAMLGLVRDKAAADGISHGILEKLEQEARLNLNALQNLTDWARAENQNLTPQLTTINPKEVLDELLPLSKGFIESKELTIRDDVSGKVTADENQFRSIVSNLLGNAIKFSPQKSTVQFNAFGLSDVYIVEVIDQGVGIPDEVIDALFSATHISSSRGTAGEKGTGLGLALIRDFARAHGGTFTLQRGLETGTIARVSIPLSSVV